MLRTISLLLIISSFAIVPTCYGEPLKNDFNGSWCFDGLADVDVGKQVKCTFTLHLKQQGDRLSGTYEAVALNGRRIDYDPQVGNEITGKVEGEIAAVSFKSVAWRGGGKAIITHKGNSLLWEIKKGSVKGEFWCPKKAILTKELKAH